MKYIEGNFGEVIPYALDNGYDWFHCNFGYEGNGKSTLSLLQASKTDKDLDIERVNFPGEDLISVFKDAKRGQVVIQDEGVEAFYNRRSMSKVNIQINKALTICRQKGICFICNLASIEMLDIYIRRHRMRSAALLETRGFAKFYTRPKLQLITSSDLLNKPIFPEPSFTDYFPKISGGKLWKEYCKKKAEYIDEFLNRTDNEIQNEKSLNNGELLNFSQVGAIVGLKNSTQVRNYITQNKLETVIIGKREYVHKKDLV